MRILPPAIEPFHDLAAVPAVRGFLHRPSGDLLGALVLTHGAGSNCQAPLLVALGEEFAAAGYLVLRCDLPYRQKRASGPPRNSAAEDSAGLARAVAALRRLSASPIYLGGMSYGGRQASLLASEQDPEIAGLLLLSYPLHPPQRPDQLRTAHFPNLRVPALFVSGERDPFATAEEIQAALKLIPAGTSLLTIPGAGHDLGGRKAPGQVAQTLLSAFRSFFPGACHSERSEESLS